MREKRKDREKRRCNNCNDLYTPEKKAGRLVYFLCTRCRKNPERLIPRRDDISLILKRVREYDDLKAPTSVRPWKRKEEERETS